MAALVECYKVCNHLPGGIIKLKASDSEFTILSTSDEYKFGDFSAGRYAWDLHNPVLLPEPILAKGKQGLWTWEGGAE
jgi:hypothetical protein